jgi:sugar lactone lactonase YvrE
LHPFLVVRIDVGKNYMKISLVAKLGEPFEKPKVRVEGLTMTPTGILYASTVFDSDSGRQSRLYRIDSRTAAVTFIGKIAAAEVDGLDFGENGKLYGAISSCLRSQAAGLRQIVTIDTATGRASSTATEITFRDVDALAIAPTGMAFITSGSSGLYAVNLLRKNERSSVFTHLRFQRFLRANDQMEGMCITSDGAIFGLCHEKRSFLVRVDPQSGRVTKLGDLGFAALCLTADKSP